MVTMLVRYYRKYSRLNMGTSYLLSPIVLSSASKYLGQTSTY